MNVVTITLKIPNGKACRNCAGVVSKNYPDNTNIHLLHNELCALFDKELRGDRRRISGTRNPWGHNEEVWVVRKCKECLEKYPDN